MSITNKYCFLFVAIGGPYFLKRTANQVLREVNLRMPGHVKMVKGAVDPDPTEFLLPSHEQRKEDQNKPFDSKKSVWVPDPKTGGYR